MPQAFAERTQKLKGDLIDQGRRVQQLIELAFEAAFERSPEKAAQASKLDDAVDTADVAIEQASVVLLTDATRSGAQLEPQHLRILLTIVKVNNELERIADVGVDVAELVMPPKPGHAYAAAGVPSFPDTFRVMANSVIGILRDAVGALMTNDPQLAKVVLQSQHTVTAFKAAIVRDAEEKIAKGKMQVDAAFVLHEIANLCELLADHCTNIAEQVIYLTTGSIVRHTTTSWVEVGNKPAVG